MHFKTIKRDEILPLLEQAKDIKEQKKILCDLLECKSEELEELITDLKGEREKSRAKEAEEEQIIKKVAKDDAFSDIATYAKYLEDENYRLIKEKNALRGICKHLFGVIDELRTILKEKN